MPVNDEQFFVFEDFLYQVLLLFSRDTNVLKCFENYQLHAPKAHLKTKPHLTHETDKSKNLVNYPPNGFIPFDGFSLLGIKKFI
jgi:hypothetical protein